MWLAGRANLTYTRVRCRDEDFYPVRAIEAWDSPNRPAPLPAVSGEYPSRNQSEDTYYKSRYFQSNCHGPALRRVS